MDRRALWMRLGAVCLLLGIGLAWWWYLRGGFDAPGNSGGQEFQDQAASSAGQRAPADALAAGGEAVRSGSVAPDSTAGGGATAVTLDTGVLMRAKASGKGEVLAALPYGVEVEVLATSGEYTQVRCLPLEGFVASRLVGPRLAGPSAADERHLRAAEGLWAGSADGDGVVVAMEMQPDYWYALRQTDPGGLAREVKALREGLERRAYWQPESPLKQRLLLFEIAVRGFAGQPAVYARTPLELLRRSPAFRIPVDLGPRLATAAPAERRLSLPEVKRSALAPGESALALPLEVSARDLRLPSTALVRLVQHAPEVGWSLGEGPDGRSLVADRPFAVGLLSRDGRLARVKVAARVDLRVLTLVPEATPASPPAYVLLATGPVLDRLAAGAARVANRKRALRVPASGVETSVDTQEFDLDGDGVLDLVLSREDCPEEAGDTNDLVCHWQDGQRWSRALLDRRHCLP
jgi:hypothetical protein